MSKFASLFLVLSVSILSVGCAFNKKFYQPDSTKVATPPDAESVYVKYGENDSIHALLYTRPKHDRAIFMLHGNAGNLTSWHAVADLFYQANYQVFIIDYPGFGNSTGEASHTNVIASTRAATNFFLNHPRIKSCKKVLMGFSLGGNLALKIGAENQESFNAMVIEGAFSNQKDAAAEKFHKPFKVLPKIFVKNKINGEALISKWKKPLLIIHSQDDNVCSYEMGKKLYHAANSTQDKELWKINGPHLAGISLQPEVYLYKIKELINSY